MIYIVLQFRIAALNEEDSDDGSQTEHFVKEATKEAKVLIPFKSIDCVIDDMNCFRAMQNSESGLVTF